MYSFSQSSLRTLIHNRRKMSAINLPATISSFFAAKGGSDTEGVVASFAEDATVWDNGEDRVLHGVAEIRDWLSGTVSGYKLTSEVVSAEKRGDQVVAVVVVAGDFPGSPYKFEYRFNLREDKITELAIDPIGSLAN